MRIIAVYFSATGNTKYAVDNFLTHFDGSEPHSIEERLDYVKASEGFDTILVAHPIYGSDMPLIMRDFLKANKTMFAGKKLITLVTQFLFSGDGGRLACRLVRGEITEHIASVHINMPTNFHLPPIMPIKNGADISAKLKRANRKIERCAERLCQGHSIKNGRGPLCFLAGFLGQRFWYRTFFVPHYTKRLRIDPGSCILCGLCVQNCPVENLKLDGQRVVPQEKCILCYRCVNLCPTGAVRLMSKIDGRVQYKGPVTDRSSMPDT